eukprot:14618593-Alexandrium_andersonii.AAC.1
MDWTDMLDLAPADCPQGPRWIAGPPQIRPLEKVARARSDGTRGSRRPLQVPEGLGGRASHPEGSLLSLAREEASPPRCRKSPPPPLAVVWRATSPRPAPLPPLA